MAVIKSKGCILSQVSLVRSDNTENMNIIFISKNIAWYSGNEVETNIGLPEPFAQIVQFFGVTNI